MDTQWPRFEVFEQARPGQPHRSIGAVHAPDAEMALLNARDVFVRRPDCASLWVAPAAAIYSRTAEELAAGAELPEAAEGPPQTYEVFQKRSQRQAETFVSHVGRVQAPSPAAALQLAVAQWGGGEAWVWWVAPTTALTRSAEDDAASMFAPALDKPYRSPNYYHVLTQMRAVRAGDAPGDGEGDA